MRAIAPILKALALPAETRVEQRVPKKLLLEHGAPSAADKRKIQEGIEELHWLASLKPIHCPTPAYQDEIREYLEIAVVSVTLRQQERGGQRLLTLIHRAIPYPLLLIAVCGSELSLSLAHKRFSQGETGKVVLDEGGILQVNLVEDHPMDQAFLSAMNTAGQPAKNLFVLYQGWVHRFEALFASRITSCFVLPATEEQAEERRLALANYARLEQEIRQLRTQANSEKQLNRRVALSLQVKQLELQLGNLREQLLGTGL